MTELTYYYSAHSAFAYLGSAHVMQICAAHGLTLVHRPIPLSPVVEAQGSMPFRQRTQAHVDYFFGREIERWAELRDVPVVSFRPTHHDADYALASHLILALGDRGPQVDALAHAILEAHWRDDADLSDASTLRALVAGLGQDADALFAKADAPEVAAQYEANGQAALAASVFGSPTYVLEGEVFYGQDRLELLERAVTRPFTPTRWVNPPVETT
ncbi:2-hydroxychromene-2-carboxylate isomerase [Tateyamaria omphalii]|uniref:2-hydroxychromene-2-carboxylate isomerase n=1 Tax=Tateyamaria omphalii TaxID=299262 RepID=UPI001C998486|nr:2-hydroxychromene-2-carboxylate isomerase [Tateyamaria omphalii]MBY5931391.1 2-hydroxychromene-2-carboxylate isomerase [Tateyamaria omphalii]